MKKKKFFRCCCQRAKFKGKVFIIFFYVNNELHILVTLIVWLEYKADLCYFLFVRVYMCKSFFMHIILFTKLRNALKAFPFNYIYVNVTKYIFKLVRIKAL